MIILSSLRDERNKTKMLCFLKKTPKQKKGECDDSFALLCFILKNKTPKQRNKKRESLPDYCFVF
jgi:hypothetical protein